MELTKASTRNTWEAVRDITDRLRNGNISPALSHWIGRQGFTLEDTVCSSVCQFDDNVFTGTLVDCHGRAWEFVADLDDEAGCELEDVTDMLGPKSPDHPQADLCDPVTMGLYFQRHQHRLAG
ncbi:MAG: hypothetical protein MI745_17970 [Pseudomonadales bacterium]|nr:hypothetical protein [Pseudomonadales bacterium]